MAVLRAKAATGLFFFSFSGTAGHLFIKVSYGRMHVSNFHDCSAVCALTLIVVSAGQIRFAGRKSEMGTDRVLRQQSR